MSTSGTVTITIESAEEIQNFVNLKDHEEKYEISEDYPHIIRNKLTNKIIKESINNAGYVQINIDEKCCPKHRLIALQFVENDDPEHKTDVDHINSDKLDNRITNLRWISHKDNVKKRRTFKKQTSEYLQNVNLEDYHKIEEYGETKFERYFYDAEHERILFKTKSNKVKVIKPTLHGKLLIVSLAPITGKSKTFGYNKLMRKLKENEN